jgi:ABC-type sugar transport system permease subunit
MKTAEPVRGAYTGSTNRDLGVSSGRWEALRRELKRGEARWGYIFTAITLLPILVFSVIPMLSVFYFAFTDYSVFGKTTDWIGLANFREAFESELFLTTVKNTFRFTLFSVPVRLGIGFFVAVLLNRRLFGISLVRSIYYLPGLTSAVAIAVVWMWLFDPRLGMANVFLNLFGIASKNWLRDPATAMWAIIAVSVWSGFGVTMIIYLAGLQGMPDTYYEAAKIDGANRWQLLRYITWPLLRPVTFYLFVTGVIGAMQVFSLVLVMTQGGPLDTTTTLVHQIYLNAMTFNRMGYASALSLVLFVMILILTLINLKFFSSDVEF